MRRSADLMQLLTRAERLMARRLATILDAEGRGPDDWRVITLLADGKGHFMTELAVCAFLPPGSLTRLVDHLVEENLLYRRVDDADRRRIRAYLTPRGRRLHERINQRMRDGLALLPIAGDDRERLEALLAALIDGLTPAETPIADHRRGSPIGGDHSTVGEHDRALLPTVVPRRSADRRDAVHIGGLPPDPS